MCNKCKIGLTMAKRKGKSINITMEDILFAGVGAVAGMVINPVLNKAVATQSESVKNAVRIGAPAAKVVGGGYVATNKKMQRNVRMLGLGLAAEGGLELGLKVLPSTLVSINGTGNGDVFDFLGSSSVEIPVTPGASLAQGGGFMQEQILGTADVYENADIMQTI